MNICKQQMTCDLTKQNKNMKIKTQKKLTKITIAKVYEDDDLPMFHKMMSNACKGPLMTTTT
jgi:hypothetical protein